MLPVAILHNKHESFMQENQNDEMKENTKKKII